MIGRLARLRFNDLTVEEETIRALAGIALPLAQTSSAFVGGYFMQDAEGQAVLLTLWRDAAGHEAAIPVMEAAMEAVRAAGAEIVGAVETFPTVLYADASGVRRLDR